MEADLGQIHFGDSGKLSLPLPAFLIEHERGLVLLDTGCRPDAHDRPPPEVYGDVVASAWPLHCPPENRLDRQINKAGFELEDVTHVIVSHTHIDHTGGLYLFPRAEFYISEEELRYAFWPHPFWEVIFGREDLERARSFKWNLLSADLDLFGDGSLQILRTPGHTPGHMSLLVKLGSRAFILAADAGTTLKNFDGVPCPVDLDTTAAFRSIERIKRVSAAHEAELWVAHDPGTWDKLGHTSEPYS
jgi:N-acyl homoserine lactone hydrolase